MFGLTKCLYGDVSSLSPQHYVHVLFCCTLTAYQQGGEVAVHNASNYVLHVGTLLLPSSSYTPYGFVLTVTLNECAIHTTLHSVSEGGASYSPICFDQKEAACLPRIPVEVRARNSKPYLYRCEGKSNCTLHTRCSNLAIMRRERTKGTHSEIGLMQVFMPSLSTAEVVMW